MCSWNSWPITCAASLGNCLVRLSFPSGMGLTYLARFGVKTLKFASSALGLIVWVWSFGQVIWMTDLFFSNFTIASVTSRAACRVTDGVATTVPYDVLMPSFVYIGTMICWNGGTIIC